MRKILIVAVLSLLVCSIAVQSANAASTVEYGVVVKVDGSVINFPDQKPFIQNSRTMVPLRFVSEALGGQVDWDDATKTAIVKKDGKEIQMPIGSNQPKVNGYSSYIDVPAQLVNSRTMVPLRFISEILGAHVDWIAATKTVDIKTTGYWSANGYSVPVKTDLKVEPGAANDPNNVDITIGIGFTDTISQQYQDAQNILASKFGEKLATEIISYVKQKKDPYSELKTKQWQENNYIIEVGSDAYDPSISIIVWNQR